MLDNIPAELRQLSQWVVAGPNKNPINPRTGQPASVTDPSTWATFDEARQAGYMHTGFVLSRDDPYTIIDLDDPALKTVNGVSIPNEDPEDVEKITNRHKRILSAFPSYTELSQSGRGIHIVVRGSIPSGVRRDRVEVYFEARYMIFTGQVINGLPITEHQPMLDAIHSEMASTMVSADLEERDAIISDEEVYNMAARAANADKFLALFNGQFPDYPSQSEADFALMSMFCFYSKSDAQVRRLFRYSALGKREKATRNDDYVNRALGKIRAKYPIPPLVDLSALFTAKPEPPPPALNVAIVEPTHAQVVTPSVVYPPGLIGEMAEHVYSSSIRQVREIGLITALGFGAGILGRCFNISNTGLNQYLIFIGPTGTGKDGVEAGLSSLMASVRAQVPAIDEFVGPGTFASGQALVRVLDRAPSFVSVLGEVGLTLQQICDKNAAPHNIQLRKVLLDLFARSGWNRWLRPSVYSDTEKNTASVRAPNVTILGESTPTNFYAALDSSHISEGLIPRFLVIEYHGLRPAANPRAFHPPGPGLVSRLLQACQTALTMKANETCAPVQLDQWAKHTLDTFDRYADDKINGAGEDEVLRHLWNRAHLKALKVAALIAVGCSINQPIVTKEVAEWAIELVKRDIENMTAKFTTGEVGTGDHAQEADIFKAVVKYPTLTPDQRATYRVPKALLDKDNIVPYSYLRRFLQQRASFKNDRRGAVVAIKIALDDLVKTGSLAVIPSDQARNTFGTDSPVYYRGEAYSI